MLKQRKRKMHGRRSGGLLGRSREREQIVLSPRYSSTAKTSSLGLGNLVARAHVPTDSVATHSSHRRISGSSPLTSLARWSPTCSHICKPSPGCIALVFSLVQWNVHSVQTVICSIHSRVYCKVKKHIDPCQETKIPGCLSKPKTLNLGVSYSSLSATWSHSWQC